MLKHYKGSNSSSQAISVAAQGINKGRFSCNTITNTFIYHVYIKKSEIIKIFISLQISTIRKKKSS